MFDLDLDGTADWIIANGYVSVAIQLPEGLKTSALRISNDLHSKTNSEIIILGTHCYGACDLYADYKKVADALVHYGHSSIPALGNDPDVRFVEVRVHLDIENAMMSVAKILPERVGILATVQYIGLLSDAKEFLEGFGKTVLLGKGDRRISYPGQVLGCNCSAASSIEPDVDAFLYIGEGDFHPLAAAFGIEKEIIVLNPVTGELRSVENIKDRMLRKRFAAIEISKTANTFLVISCTKVGQNRSDEAEAITEKIRKCGKTAYRITLDEIGPEALMPYNVDVYVNTACPRISMDDSAKYSRPMLTLTETEVALGLRDWSDYRFDEITNP
jgi:diphthamide biosynthesis enzyme Dph2